MQTEEGLASPAQAARVNADVFLTNMRPGALRRLGLDAEELSERYPALVYARGHGYGVRGPDADQAGYDATAFWARGGMAHILTPPDREYPIGPRGAMGDRNGAMALAFGVAAALLKRARPGRVRSSTSRSRHGDVDPVVRPPGRLGWGRTPSVERPGSVVNPLVGSTDQGRSPHSARLSPAGPLLGTASARSSVAPTCVRPPLRRHGGPRDNGTACVAELDAEFARRTFEEWKSILRRLDAPWAPVQSVAELLEDPQVEANGYIGEVVVDGGPSYRLPAVPVQFDGRPPRCAGSRARRGHRGHPARAGLRLGGHHPRSRRRGSSFERANAQCRCPTSGRRGFWAAAAAHALVLARCRAVAS